MSVTRVQRLLATGVVSSALAVGGLTIAPSSAQAADSTSTATYTCASSLPIPAGLAALVAPSFKVPAQITLENLPSVVTANVPVPALPVVGTFDFSQLSSAGLGGLLAGTVLTVEGAVNTVLATAGLAQVAVPLNLAFTQVNGAVATVSGQLASFTPTSAGSLPIPLPSSFDFGAAVPVFGALGYHCTLDPGSASGGGVAGGSMGTLTVQKAGSSVKAKVLTKKVHAGGMGKVKVSVKTAGTATGKVVAKLKGKTIGKGSLKKGKVTLKLKKLSKVGVNKIKLVYSGSAASNAAKKTVKVTVTK